MCDDVAEVVDSYVSVESFCVHHRETRKTQAGRDLKTPKEYLEQSGGHIKCRTVRS